MQTHFTPAVHRIDPDDDVAVALRQLEPGETVVAVVSGGNIDLARFASLVS